MMTIQQKQKLFIDEYAINGWTLADTYKLLCLVGTIYNSSIKKDPNITVYGILNKIHPDDVHYKRTFEAIQYHIMGYLDYSNAKFATFGLTSAKEIVTEIKRLLEQWLPF